MTTIKCANHRVFQENFKEYNSYIQAQKKGLVISNAERLLKLIEKYFQIIVFLSDKKQSGNFFQIKKIWYEIKLSGNNREGEEKIINILNSEVILEPILNHLLPLFNDSLFEEYIDLSSRIFRTREISIEHKIALLNLRASIFKEKWRFLILSISEKSSLDFIEEEKKLYERIIFSNNGVPKRLQEYLKIDDIIKAYHLNLRTETRVYIAHGSLVKINQSLLTCLNKIEDQIKNKEVAKKLIPQILSSIALNNNLFHTNSRQELNDIFSEYYHYLSQDQTKHIKEILYFNPQHFELSNTSIKMASPNFPSRSDENVITVVHFVIPHSLAGPTEIQTQGATIYFNPVDNLYDDAVFNFLDQIDLNINGLPLSYFSDSLGNIGACSNITIEYNDFIHPDFDIINGTYEEKDLSVEEAKRGGKYTPFKDNIIDTLYQTIESEQWPYTDLNIKTISSNLFSNLFVSYVDNSKKPPATIHQVAHLITNYRSYIDARERYLSSISEYYFENNNLEIRELVENVEISSYISFQIFCCKLLEMVLKKVIETGGGQSLFWKNENIPNEEKKSQVAIYSLLRFITEIKGIKLIRETIAADGSVDFAFLYSIDGKNLCICVELKNAHNQNLVHGIETQLPLYINDIGRKEGIFLVLWFKNDEFNKPTKFSDLQELRKKLKVAKPKGYDIRTIIIDCNKQLSPSNPRRSLE